MSREAQAIFTLSDQDGPDEEQLLYVNAMRVARYYERYRHIYVSSFYRALPKNAPADTSNNWTHFVQTAELIKEIGADTNEFIAAQFQTATSKAYPYPSHLHSKRAVGNWRRALDSPRAIDLVAHQRETLELFKERYQLNEQEIVSNEYWPFFSWFRALYLLDTQLPAIADDALKELRSESLRLALHEADYDVVRLERRLKRAQKGDSS